MSRRRGPTPKRVWQPMALGAVDGALSPELRAVLGSDEVWLNDRYTCHVKRLDGGGVHLSLRRNDRKPLHDWRDMQRIKNDIVGPEREAVELYPAESRLVDSANQYHLWVLPVGERFSFGFDLGRVTDDGAGGVLVDGEPVPIPAELAPAVGRAVQRQR